MEVKTTYIAFDDEEFTSEEECLKYEENTKYERSMKLFDAKRQPINDPFPDIAFEKAQYIYVTDAPLAEQFFIWIYSYAGYRGVENPKNDTLYRYDERDDSWIDLQQEIDNLMNIKTEILWNKYKDERERNGHKRSNNY